MNKSQRKRVWVMVTPGSDPLDVTGPYDVFRIANLQVEAGAYDVQVVAVRERAVTTDGGLGLVAHAMLAEALAEGMPHTVVVGGGDPDVPEGSDERLLADWLRAHAQLIPRIASVCTGAFVLGAAGLLAGKPATTHWLLTDQLSRLVPESQVDNGGLYTERDGVWTSAGLTSGMDMALAMVEEDHGHTVSLDVARYLVLFLRRSGNQPQFSAPLAAQLSERPVLRELQPFIVANLAEDLSVTRLAREAAMSPRNLSRTFKMEFDVTPGVFVRQLRLDEARRLLASTTLPISEIALRVGAGTESTLRRWFQQGYGISPVVYRERFGGAAEHVAVQQ